MNRRLLFLIAGLVAGCGAEPPEPPVAFQWTFWANPDIGYSLDVPDVYKAEMEDGGRSVLFRWRGRVPVKIYLSGMADAEQRGLWVGHEPAAEILLGGQAGLRYDYDHCDGPFCSRMAAFVIPWKGEWLALEFRTGAVLNEVNQAILESFALSSEATAGS